MNQKIDVFHNASIITNRKSSKVIYIFCILLLLLFISFLCLLFIPYHPYENSNGYIKKTTDNYVFCMYVEKNQIGSFKNNSLLIENKSYDSKVIHIEDDYYTINSKLYYLVILDIPLQEKDKIENNILNVVIEKPTTTLFKQIQKGWKNWKN